MRFRQPHYRARRLRTDSLMLSHVLGSGDRNPPIPVLSGTALLVIASFPRRHVLTKSILKEHKRVRYAFPPPGHRLICEESCMSSLVRRTKFKKNEIQSIASHLIYSAMLHWQFPTACPLGYGFF